MIQNDTKVSLILEINENSNETIKSIINQDFITIKPNDIELIIFNTNDEFNIQNINDKDNIIKYYNSNNKKREEIVNNIIKDCKSEFIMILNSNNIYKPNCISIFYENLKKNPSSDILYGGYIFNNLYYEALSITPLTFLFNFDTNYPIMFRKNAIKNLNLNNDLNDLSIFDLYIQILENNSNLLSYNYPLSNLININNYNDKEIYKLKNIILSRNGDTLNPLKYYSSIGEIKNKKKAKITLYYDIIIDILNKKKNKKDIFTKFLYHDIHKYLKILLNYNKIYFKSLNKLFLLKKNNIEVEEIEKNLKKINTSKEEIMIKKNIFLKKNVIENIYEIKNNKLDNENLNVNEENDYNDILNFNILEDIQNIVKENKTQINLNNVNSNFTNENFIDIKENNIVFKNVYIISKIEGGGSKKYLNDLINNLKTNKVQFIFVDSLDSLYNMQTDIKNNDIILVQHLLFTDICINKLLITLNEIKNKNNNIQIITTIHDWYYLNNEYKNLYQYSNDTHFLYLKNIKPLNSCIELINITDKIIVPSLFVKEYFEKYFDVNDKIILCPHIDININYNYLNIPKIYDNIINIAIPHQLSIYKGLEYYKVLFNIVECNNYKIVYHIFTNNPIKILSKNELNNKNIIIHKEYDEDNFFQILKENNIHILTYFNKWGETYCYSLSKGINSGLPIIYKNIGAFEERIPKNDKYFQLDKNININKDTLYNILEKSIEFVKNNKIKTDYMDIYTEIPDFYKKIFGTDYKNELIKKYKGNKIIYEKIHDIIEPYAIYFPQFHSIPENDLTFYEGFHDNKNLLIANNNSNTFLSPLNSLFGNYNLKYQSYVVNNQIITAKAYGIKGFAIYYYWFSKNTISNNNMLMKDAIDKFFEENLENFDVFFVYANEDWSNNPAFNQKENNNIIMNIYNKDTITQNINNLIPYFKHQNYKKVDNKPVFMIHHPWLLNSNELELFKIIANDICINNGFNGINLILNGMAKKIDGYVNYHHHSNYKTLLSNSFIKIINNKRYIDYKAYIDNYLPNEDNQENLNDIHTIFTNFDNSVRLYNHKNKDILITKTINNNLDEFSRFLNIQLNKYPKKDKTSKISKIFLMNAWNEWGEQMVLEPSNELGFAYLETFLKEIIKFA